MSLNHSPSIVTSGLVLYTDMSNTQKSWKGAPTTNLLTYSQDFNNAAWLTSGATVTANAAIAPDGTNTADRILSTGWILQTPGGILNSTTYTYSVYLKSATGSTQSVQIAIEDSGGPTTYPSYTVTSSWQRFTATLTSAAATSNFRPGIRAGDVYAWGAQLEVSSFATPYIPTTSAAASRSNTQAIVDLTGNRTITASSLTYTSDNTFSFNGTTNYFSPTRISIFISGVTYNIWMKTISTDSVVIYDGNAAQNIIGDATNGVVTGFGVHGGKVRYTHYNGAWQTITGSVSVNTGNWAHIVATHNSNGTCCIYVNGIQDTTSTITYNSNVGVDVIGRGYAGDYFTGNIGLVGLYNRALSADEVKQNFNALRGRYGI